MSRISVLNILCVSVSLLSISMTSCAKKNQTYMDKNKKMDFQSEDGKYIIYAPLVIKNFVKKNGVVTDQGEVYLQRSVQDYFIKFCESEVSYKDLHKYLPKDEFDIRAVKLEVEFREGSWDICDENFDQQSRIGKYVIIHRIIED